MDFTDILDAGEGDRVKIVIEGVVGKARLRKLRNGTVELAKEVEVDVGYDLELLRRA